MLAVIKAIYAYIEAWKSQDFNGVWTRFPIRLRCFNQLSYEDKDLGSWSFVGAKEPVRSECKVIYEISHMLNCGCEIK